MKYLILSSVLFLTACGEPASTADETTDTEQDSADAPDTWTNFGEDFMTTYCVECHRESPKNFASYADVVANQDFIRCGVASSTQTDCGDWPPANQFPIGNGAMPTDAERDQLIAWIDAGMPE